MSNFDPLAPEEVCPFAIRCPLQARGNAKARFEFISY